MKFLLVIVACCIIQGAVTNCAANRLDIGDEHKIYVRRLPSSDFFFHRIDVSQVGEEFVISGRLNRRKNSAVVGSGHIDIAVIDPKGKVMAMASTFYIPKTFKRRSHRGSSFKFHIPVSPPAGSVVRVTHHRLRLPRLENIGLRGFDCGKNAAIP